MKGTPSKVKVKVK